MNSSAAIKRLRLETLEKQKDQKGNKHNQPPARITKIGALLSKAYRPRLFVLIEMQPMLDLHDNALPFALLASDSGWLTG